MGPETCRQALRWTPQHSSALHGAWHTCLNECHLAMACPSVNTLKMPFLSAPGLSALYFSDFQSTMCALKKKKEL